MFKIHLVAKANIIVSPCFFYETAFHCLISEVISELIGTKKSQKYYGLFHVSSPNEFSLDFNLMGDMSIPMDVPYMLF